FIVGTFVYQPVAGRFFPVSGLPGRLQFPFGDDALFRVRATGMDWLSELPGVVSRSAVLDLALQHSLLCYSRGTFRGRRGDCLSPGNESKGSRGDLIQGVVVHPECRAGFRAVDDAHLATQPEIRLV